jgi:tellurite resistance-related uncharacterized protein
VFDETGNTYYISWKTVRPYVISRQNRSVWLGLFALVAVGTVLLSGTAVAQDQFEPNDNVGTAATISEGEYTGLTNPPGDIDYYAVELAPGEGVNVTGSVDTGTVSLMLYSPSQSRISVRTAPRTSLAVASQQGGTYSLAVLVSNSTGPYSLSVQTGDDIGLSPDRFELNDQPGTATRVSPGEYDNLTVLNGGVDYYTLDLTTGTTLTAEIESDSAADTLSLAVRGPDASNRSTATAAETVSFTATQTRPHYVVVNATDDGSTRYALELSRTDASGADGGGRTDGGDGEADTGDNGGADNDSGDSSGPGFGLLAALLGLCGAGYLSGRQIF